MHHRHIDRPWLWSLKHTVPHNFYLLIYLLKFEWQHIRHRWQHNKLKNMSWNMAVISTYNTNYNKYNIWRLKNISVCLEMHVYRNYLTNEPSNWWTQFEYRNIFCWICFQNYIPRHQARKHVDCHIKQEKEAVYKLVRNYHNHSSNTKFLCKLFTPLDCNFS